MDVIEGGRGETNGRANEQNKILMLVTIFPESKGYLEGCSGKEKRKYKPIGS